MPGAIGTVKYIYETKFDYFHYRRQRERLPDVPSTPSFNEIGKSEDPQVPLRNEYNYRRRRPRVPLRTWMPTSTTNRENDYFLYVLEPSENDVPKV